MILFTDDYKKNYKETPSGILLAESQDLIVPQGIITIDMATDDEKALIYGKKPKKKNLLSLYDICIL